MGLGASRNTKRIVLLLWLLVAVFYFYLSYDYIRVSRNDKAFTEYLQHVVQIAGAENRPAKEIRALLLVKAEELSIPVHGEQITVLGGGDSLNVAVSYYVDIELPMIQRQLYSKTFSHEARYQQQN